MKKKETVVLFDGESDFILPRSQKYDRRKGKSTFVAQDGSTQSGTSKTTDSTQNNPAKTTGGDAVIPPPAGGVSNAPQPPAGGKAGGSVVLEPVGTNPSDFNNPVRSDLPSGGQTGSGTGYTNYSVGKFSMPDPTSPNFCENVNEFILTNGGGIATPPEITAARAALSKYCSNTPPSSGDPSTGSPRTGGNPPSGDNPPPSGDNPPPSGDTPPPSGDTPPSGTGGKIRLPKPEGLPKEPKAKVKENPVVEEDSETKKPLVVIEGLGLPIGTNTGGGMPMGGGGGGGAEEQPIAEKKKSYWWILIVAAAIGGIYYYRSRKK